MLTTFDEWTWLFTGCELHNIGTKYYFCVAIIAILWRSTGNPFKLKDSASKLFSNIVSRNYFSKVPGRPLKSRWGAIISIEALILKASLYIGAVFNDVFRRNDKPQPKTKNGPGQDDDDDFQATQTKRKETALRATNSSLFLIKVCVSYISKCCLSIF